MFYTVKIPAWIAKIYPSRTWKIDTTDKKLYLTFDDGPHPTITPFVLDELKKKNAKATFFCIGKNVELYPDVYARILNEGHAVGNHTQDHLNGWKTKDSDYLDNIANAKKYIDSSLFRPPYGKITRFQQKQLSAPRFNLQTVMWTILSGDFDEKVLPEQCLRNVLLNGNEGSIVVFHDSEKARLNLEFSLGKVLEYFGSKGYTFEKIGS